jgi:hypothetical protein
VANRIVEVMQGKSSTQEQQLPGKELPIEEIELVGEKVNHKIALSPENSPSPRQIAAEECDSQRHAAYASLWFKYGCEDPQRTG